MTAAVYSLAAAMAAVLATRAWLLDRDDPARRSFMGMGWSLALAYMAFALSLLPAAGDLRAVWVFAGLLAPAYAFRTLDQLFDRGAGTSPLAIYLPWIAGTFGLVAAAGHFVLYRGTPRASPPELLGGLVAAGITMLILRRLTEAEQTADLQVERHRLRWLRVTVTLAALLSAAEWMARNLGPAVDDTSLRFMDRGLALQGAIPPASTLFSAIATYVIYHAMLSYRMVSLQRLASRLTALAIASGALLVAHTVTLWWVELARFPLHSGLLLFLVTAGFLSVWDAWSPPLYRWTNRRFNQPGQALDDALVVLRKQLPGLTQAQRIADALAQHLHASGRFRSSSIYLFDADADAYTCRASRGLGAANALTAVAADPFIHAWQSGQRAYHVQAPASEVHGDLMEAMGADHVLPLRRGSTIHGWLCLADEVWSDGISPEERDRVLDVCDFAALGLANIDAFRQQEEQHRLAALGTMAAGLAHEIRNPLAGLKGAAQVLDHDARTPLAQLNEDAAEMLDVIQCETDRLNDVVTQFLDFARPLAIRREPATAQQILAHVARLLRAEGLGAGVALDVEVDETLPELRLDAGRLSQVLLNLAQNAVEAVGDAGRVTLRAMRSTDEHGRRCVTMEVVDDGPGFSEDVARQLFVPFFTTRDAGTGLGLPISRRIVEAHGGTLRANRRDGTTRFTAQIPA